MNKLLLLPLFMLILLSCSKKDELDSMQHEEGVHSLSNMTQPQKWKLVKMSGQIPNSVQTGADMPWQEYYVFSPDGSFSKVRQKGKASTSATGVYTYNSVSGEQYLELIYPAFNNIIGSCNTAELKETLMVHEDGLQSFWWACDGPGLWYEKVN